MIGRYFGSRATIWIAGMTTPPLPGRMAADSSLTLEEVLTLIGQEDERMTALRQNSKFAGVLEPAERWAIYARFESKPNVPAQPAIR